MKYEFVLHGVEIEDIRKAIFYINSDQSWNRTDFLHPVRSGQLQNLSGPVRSVRTEAGLPDWFQL
jgi:hypothetical protein